MAKFLFLVLSALTIANTAEAQNAFVRDISGGPLVTRAHWVSSSQIVLNLNAGTYISPNSTKFFLVDDSNAVKSSSSFLLPYVSSSGNSVLLNTSGFSQTGIQNLLTKPLKVVMTNNENQVLDVTQIHYAGILDQLFFYGGNDLGGECTVSICFVKLWAPTAQNVRVLLYKNGQANLEQAQVAQAQREAYGVWSIRLPANYVNTFYQYEVTVYQPQINRVAPILTTDPYSKSLSVNGDKSQMVNLTSNDLMPRGWQNSQKPKLRSVLDSVIYELHIRDFSANDASVPMQYQGTYGAFSLDSNGTKYLGQLASAGMTHLHLLPFNDFGTVDENKANWNNYRNRGQDLQEPQSIIGGIRNSDPFNWGYDPVHLFAPEGSYAESPNGASRIYEVRQMVQSINRLGLRVVQDVVFNHTYQSGLDRYSVLDRIVPLYYYRLNQEGKAYSTSCCPDTASENRMMEKMMIDAVVYWARTYKVDGFRFDLMSFHSVKTMAKIRQALLSLNLSRDGVDGSKILLYGEGWNYGSFFDKNPREAMTMENSYGTGYGFFNDRLRDAIRGGTTNSNEKSDQGFATGLFFDFNQEPANKNTPPDLNSQRDKLLHLGDVIKVGLAGNLRNFRFQEHFGQVITGYDLKFRKQPVAFAAEAIETINYVSAHDGYSLFDAIQAKAPYQANGRNPMTATSEDRQRMQQMALAIPMLSQGVPFIEAGSELLRTKNGDQDSYNSGDYFNRVDWTGQENYWGQGLPPAWKNLNDWNFWRPRLQSPELQVKPVHIQATKKYFLSLLKVRQSSDLFKLNTLQRITNHLKFIDTASGAGTEAGLIGMLLEGGQETLLIFFNVSRESRIFQHPALQYSWALHPYFNAEVDPVLSQVVMKPDAKGIQIPGRTTVILRKTR